MKLPYFLLAAMLLAGCQNTPPKTAMQNSKILPGIPPMSYGNPSAVCFIGSVMRLMEHIGDPVAQDEVFALSGVGLCFPWLFASSCDEVSRIPEIPARTFEAFGYESEHLKGEAVKDKAVCLEKIKRSIDRGRPVIGFGITTKEPMSCLITGYDDNGLYTRSFWPPEGAKRDSEEYFHSPDWHENCHGLLFVGDKTGERLTGAAAYARIVEWARNFRWERKSKYDTPVDPDGREIFVNGAAFNAMCEWLLDDTQWEHPNEKHQEVFLKQCGLLLFDHYRWQLSTYLKKLDAEFPGVVNPPVFAALERIGKAIPGAHKSDLWLHEAVDPALADFSAMRDRALREKVADYVRQLSGFDDRLQWTLFMPDSVKHSLESNGITLENFEYVKMPAIRFVGVLDDENRSHDTLVEMMRALDAMPEQKSGFDYDLQFFHHGGLTVDNAGLSIWGRFMKAGTTVPDGFVGIDFVPF
ncbi:MAG: hypothetical protein FWG05_01965, partial [Kiritimatiellaeota bacterium]|nr:hypothetical protein [Kiritimatiellota bacterium]